MGGYTQQDQSPVLETNVKLGPRVELDGTVSCWYLRNTDSG